MSRADRIAEIAEAHAQAMQAVGLAAQVLTPNHDAFARLIESNRAVNETGWLTDPTLFRQAAGNKNLDQQVRLARAALAFILAVQEVKGELAAEAKGGSDHG